MTTQQVKLNFLRKVKQNGNHINCNEKKGNQLILTFMGKEHEEKYYS
jgi:hypothetical protein